VAHRYFHHFLPVRARNLHDPAWIGVQLTRHGKEANPVANLNKKDEGNRPFSLIISCLSHALFALLQRNIITFNAAGYDYFPGQESPRQKRRTE
jgi:hypothetical protein